MGSLAFWIWPTIFSLFVRDKTMNRKFNPTVFEQQANIPEEAGTVAFNIGGLPKFENGRPDFDLCFGQNLRLLLLC